mgnify:CR=1 FL=1|jgi:hypothetical protein
MHKLDDQFPSCLRSASRARSPWKLDGRVFLRSMTLTVGFQEGVHFAREPDSVGDAVAVPVSDFCASDFTIFAGLLAMEQRWTCYTLAFVSF